MNIRRVDKKKYELTNYSETLDDCPMERINVGFV